MERYEKHHRATPVVIPSDRESEIVISATGYHYAFADGEDYTVEIIPKDVRELPRSRSFLITETNRRRLTVRASGGALCFTAFFGGEQEWRLKVTDSAGATLALLSLYSVRPDLYGLDVFRGDLHLHTTGSDGELEPELAAIAYREHGFDFISVTDHHNYQSSLRARDAMRRLPTDFTVYPGEEVHNRDAGYFHFVNFGGAYSVNEIILRDPEGLRQRMLEEAKTVKTPEGVDAAEFVFRRWICDEIRKSGGLAIFPHPYWTIGEEYHTETAMSEYLFETGTFDVFEAFGNTGKLEKSYLQASLYEEMRARGYDFPVVGSSDAHSYDETATNRFNVHSTLAFAKSVDNVKEAVLEHRSVAVRQEPGQREPYIVGPFRLVRYADFLLTYYAPTHREICKMEGYWMRRRYSGDASEAEHAERMIAATRDELRRYRREFFGR